MEPDPYYYRSLLYDLKCCVIAPTYNNASTLRSVLAGIARYVSYVIVVNDGSTDDTGLILDRIQGENLTMLDIISFPKNRGKGKALREGFIRAAELGFDYAITIDTDGQHDAKDIMSFALKVQELPGALIVGARNMDQEGIPAKSSFGNKFSNFWYRIETGITLPDTQSGFRLYPVSRIKEMRFFTSKYEFEIEVMVRAAWAGCPVSWVPVSVYYAPREKRISHFRPFVDFTRISILNTILVIIAFLWIKPRNLIRKMSWKNFRQVFRREFMNQSQSAFQIALASGFGVFMGIVPIWGYQLIVGLTLAHFFKLNKAIVFLTANISIPPMIPVILFLSFAIGGWIIGTPTDIGSIGLMSFEFIKHHFYQYLIGSIAFAVMAGLLFFLITWALILLFRKKRSQTADSECFF